MSSTLEVSETKEDTLCDTMFAKMWAPLTDQYEAPALTEIESALKKSFEEVVGPLVQQLEELTLEAEKEPKRRSSDRDATDEESVSSDEASSSEEKSKKKKTKGKGKKKPKTGENRRTDGYHVFLRAKMGSGKKGKKPKKGDGMTMQEAVAMWRGMSDEEKKPWRLQAEKINKARGLAKS
jgi:hypothetical protein